MRIGPLLAGTSIGPLGYTAPMRLTTAEVADIAAAAKASLPPGTRVALFGSRTDDARRGGDIDLLVETATAMDARQLFKLNIQFTGQLYWHMGERRIDVLMVPAGAEDTRLIVTQARRQAIELVRT